jgi:flagellar motor switch protein FliN/FliY
VNPVEEHDMAWNAAPNGADAGLAGSVEGGLAVDPAPFPALGDRMPQPGEPRDLRLLSDIELELCVEIGRARLPLRQLLALTPGTVIELDRALGEPVDVLVNGKLVAKGQVVTIGDEFGVRLSQIVDPAAVAPPGHGRRG